MQLSQTSAGKRWLAQFKQEDERKIAAPLLDAMEIVSMQEFEYGLRRLITSLCTPSDVNVAFYIIAATGDKGLYDYEDSNFDGGYCEDWGGRSLGDGPCPKSKKLFSKGTFDINRVLFKILGLVKEDCPNLWINPGPDDIRQHKMRKFFILTDFVGTGWRVREYLTTMWRSASIRSWHSSKHITVDVVAYAMTYKGRYRAEYHVSRPKTHYVIKCPSLFDYTKQLSSQKKAAYLCGTYFLEKIKWNKKKSYYGYDSEENWAQCSLLHFGRYDEQDARRYRMALIAFEYGFPDTVPRLISEPAKGWKPLFSDRKGLKNAGYLNINYNYQNYEIAPKFKAFSADNPTIAPKDMPCAITAFFEDPLGQKIYAIMKALRKTRNIAMISRLTDQSKLEIKETLLELAKLDWTVQNSHYLTDKGMNILSVVDNASDKTKTIYKDYEKHYYPRQLRGLATT